MDHFKAIALLDIYGSLLTERQQEICSLYYEQDLSLSEIGEDLEISRAAVSKALDTSKKQLTRFEEAVGMLKLKERLEELEDKSILSQEQISMILDDTSNE